MGKSFAHKKSEQALGTCAKMENSFVRVKFAFREAVESQDITTLKMLLTNSVGAAQIRKVIAKELFDGYTPLQRACLDQNREIVTLFVECGVEIEQRGKYGWTALHAASFACRPGNDISIISLLLNSCADVIARDEHGCLPVDIAESSAVRGILLGRMEEKGHSELAEMYRKLDNLKYSSKVDIVEDWVRESATAITISEESSKVQQATGLQESTSRHLSVKRFGSSCFYTTCEHRERLISEKPLLRRNGAFERRRVASLNIKGRRDSGISVDSSDSLTYV